MPQLHITTLNNLLEMVIDSANGYREARRDQETTMYLDHFVDRARERDEIAREMSQAITALGGTPSTSGTILSNAHRFLTRVKAVSTVGDSALLEAIVEGETALVQAFENALTLELNDNTRQYIAGAAGMFRTNLEQAQAMMAEARRTPVADPDMAELSRTAGFQNDEIEAGAHVAQPLEEANVRENPVAAGVAGGAIGAIVGTAIAPGIGTVVGALIGGGGGGGRG